MRGANESRALVAVVGWHSLGLAIGGLCTGVVAFSIGSLLSFDGRVPLGILAVVLALVAGKVAPIELTGSPWRVPRSLSRRGRRFSAFVFGAYLGTGVLTALSSPAFYLILAWCVAADEWGLIWPVMLAFGVGRAVPMILLSVTARRTEANLQNDVPRAAEVVANLAPVEAVLLLTFSMVLMV